MTKEIIGREQLTDYIKKVTAEDKISHAYLFEGEKGMGKLFLAKYFAKTILCTEKRASEVLGRPVVEACRNCISCKQTEGNNHPDIIFVEHEKPNLITVEEIRKQVVSTAEILPYSSEHKIYIIKDAEKMNEQAQNALLKTIEEPPAYVIIFLLSANKGKLLETIKSRCVELDVRPVDKEVVKNFLKEKYEVSDYVATYAAEFSAGNIGKAIRFAVEDDFLEMKRIVIHIMQRLDVDSEAALVEDISHLNGYKNEIKDCLDLMTLWFRDMLVLKATGDVNRLIFKEEYVTLKEQANVRSYEAIDQALATMEKARQRLEAHADFNMVMKVMISYLKEK